MPLTAKKLNHFLRFSSIRVLAPFRVCETCESKMTEGYVFGDGEGYACSDKCLYVDGYTKEQKEKDYTNGDIYWTTWEDG
tara:strand:+ start:609 stop:848 length:240 start_codon:yes stop_codon:yes gene_type:complete